MKKILLLGDSIRIGYQQYVRDFLNGKAEVYFPEENGRFAKHTLWGVNLWIKEFGTPDIVHWNNGLWDLHHEAPMIEALSTKDEYIETLGRIINELKRTSAKIIFATTTPVPSNAIGRSNAEIDSYNKVAIELMNKNSIEINDLNALIKSGLSENICDDNLHLTFKAYQECGKQVAQVLLKHI